LLREHRKGFALPLSDIYCHYSLLDILRSTEPSEFPEIAAQHLAHTLKMVAGILPYLKDGAQSHVISLPTKPCLDKGSDELRIALSEYSESLRHELLVLGGKLTCYDSLKFI
jgi:hypothetical protein